MKITNWNDLAAAIAELTPEQRATPVTFLEGYDDWAICEPTALTVADEPLTNKEGDTVPAGQPYLEP